MKTYNYIQVNVDELNEECELPISNSILNLKQCFLQKKSTTFFFFVDFVCFVFGSVYTHTAYVE